MFRSGSIQAVTFLLRFGADSRVRDKQQFTFVHLCCQGGNLMMLLYLLSYVLKSDGSDNHALGSFINIQDEFGQTGVHWVSYNNPVHVGQYIKVLRQCGADLDIHDKYGMTPLHHAVVQKNYDAVVALIKHGAQLNVRSKDSGSELEDNKTPSELAAIRHHDGLKWFKDAERDALHGDSLTNYEKIIFWLTPFVILIIAFHLVSFVKWYFYLPCLIAAIALSNIYITRYLITGNLTEKLQKTPVMASIFAASVFLCELQILFDFLPNLYYKGYLGIICFSQVFVALCSFYFYKSMTKDPGYINSNELFAHSSTEQLKVQDEIIQLADIGQLDDRYYCVSCFARKRIRSKHCKRCNKCVSLFDHHCPWIYNCVGQDNHRAFIGFMLPLFLSSILFIFMAKEKLAQWYDENPLADTDPLFKFRNCNLCLYAYYQSSLLMLAFWVFFQNLWMFFVLAFQLYLISSGQTTNEFSNFFRFEYLKQGNRFQNPFDNGFFRNWYSFWFPSKGEYRHVNWKEQFEVPTAFSKTSIRAQP